MLRQVSAKAAFAKYIPPSFLPFTVNAIFPESETSSVPREKAELGSRLLSGSLVFFHHCDVDYFTVDRDGMDTAQLPVMEGSVIKSRALRN